MIKNKNDIRDMINRHERQRFSIRKSAIYGTTSVLLGASILYSGNNVQADEVQNVDGAEQLPEISNVDSGVVETEHLVIAEEKIQEPVITDETPTLDQSGVSETDETTVNMDDPNEIVQEDSLEIGESSDSKEANLEINDVNAELESKGEVSDPTTSNSIDVNLSEITSDNGNAAQDQVNKTDAYDLGQAQYSNDATQTTDEQPEISQDLIDFLTSYHDSIDFSHPDTYENLALAFSLSPEKELYTAEIDSALALVRKNNQETQTLNPSALEDNTSLELPAGFAEFSETVALSDNPEELVREMLLEVYSEEDANAILERTDLSLVDDPEALFNNIARAGITYSLETSRPYVLAVINDKVTATNITLSNSLNQPIENTTDPTVYPGSTELLKVRTEIGRAHV